VNPRIVRFDQACREQFRQSVRDAAPDRRRMAEDAARLSAAWPAAIVDAGRHALLGPALRCKAAGYNADLYGWVIKASRAIEAADRLLDGADELRFELSDLLLGEYFLLHRAAHRGMKVETTTPRDVLEGRFLETVSPVSSRPGFEPVECDLTVALTPGETTPSETMPDRVDVAFVATMATYVPPMLPVIESLRRRGRSSVLLAPACARDWPGLRSRDLPCPLVPIESLMDDSLRAMHELEGRRIGQACDAREDPLASMLDYRGVPLWPLVRTDVRHLARRYVPHVLTLDAATERFVRRTGVRVVACARLRRATDVTIAMAARRAGASVAMLMHGHVGGEPERLFVDGDFGVPDRVFAWGDEQREIIIGKGAAAERVIVTGNPSWDDASPGDERAAADLRRRLGRPDHERLVALIGQPDARPQLEAIIAAAARVPGVCLLCRPHPSEGVEPYERAASKVGEGRCLVIGESQVAMADLLRGCDAALTLHSTVNLEAIAHGCPVITVAMGELAKEPRLVDLAAHGLPLVTDGETLTASLQTIAADHRAWRATTRNAVAACRRAWGMDADATSAERVADAMEGLAAGDACRGRKAA
jgi:hypothetical protein